MDGNAYAINIKKIYNNIKYYNNVITWNKKINASRLMAKTILSIIIPFGAFFFSFKGKKKRGVALP